MKKSSKNNPKNFRNEIRESDDLRKPAKLKPLKGKRTKRVRDLSQLEDDLDFENAKLNLFDDLDDVHPDYDVYDSDDY